MSSLSELQQSASNATQQIDQAAQQITQYIQTLEQKKQRLQDTMQTAIEAQLTSQIDMDAFGEYLQEPYVLIPKAGHEWYLIVPKWLKMAVGYQDSETRSHRIFIVNKYAKWLSEVPKELEVKLKFEEGLPFKVEGNRLITGTDLQGKGWDKYKPFLSMRDGNDKIRIKPKMEFKLIAKLIEDGTLPFQPSPVAQSDLREWNDAGHEKYLAICEEKNIGGIQDRAWAELLRYGAIGCYWSFGSGKSLFGHRGVACIKGSKLVVVPSIILMEQWKKRLEVFNPSTCSEVTVITYHGYPKVCNQEWTLTIFDEHQHLPANNFMKLSTIKTKYRLGFSGSPYREDGREAYIFALTGYPVGMSWDELRQLHVMNVPQFRVYVVANKTVKDRKLDELMRLPLKTIVFCDSLEYGEEISKRLSIPFISGTTSNRLEKIQNSIACVVSRVGDEGLSDLNLQRVIEVSFLFGSRMQESQRFGRLMHSKEDKTQHIIVMTRQEFESYQKRLMAITERGFKLELIQEAT